MSFPAYPTYKDSGVEWLGEVPAGWTVSKLGYFFREPPCYGVLVPDFDPDGVPMLRITDMEHEFIDTSGLVTISAELSSQYSRTIIKKGDVVLSLVGTIGKAFVVGPKLVGVNLSRAIARIQLDNNTLARYLCWIFRSCEFTHFIDLVCRGAAQRVLNLSDLNAFIFSFPSYVEQCAISAFLDHETARIDALIQEQQRLIELLKDKRKAVISHAVTKGLDPTVPMKDSGVEWLGEVPVHWKVSKLGHYAQILTGFPFPSASFSHDESDVRLLRGANIGVGSLKWIDSVYWSLSEVDNLSSYLMKEGQIVLGMDRPWISEGMRIARVTKEDMPCLLLQRVAAISPSAELDGEYLFCLLASELFKTYVEPDLTGVSVPHISPEQIMSFQIPVPEIGEQRRVSGFIRNQLDQMAALFEQASESVELLQERRSALISAAVIGKIDVRGWQPPASAQTPELAQEAM